MSRNRATERISVFKLTNGEWYPSYVIDGYHNGNQNPKLVEVSFLELIPFGKSPKEWRVAVWGADDTGMDIDFPSEEREKAFALFVEVITQQYVDRDYLTSKGFEGV